MTPAQGQTLRRAGLVLEALCVLGLLALARGKVQIGKGSGLDPSLVMAAGLGLGFVLWAVGTAAIYRGRR